MQCPRCGNWIVEQFYCIRCGLVPTMGRRGPALIKLVILLLLLVGFGRPVAAQQDLPTNLVMQDYTKTQLRWEWYRGALPAALGFRVYCGPQSNYYTEMVEIQDPTARTYLLTGLVDNILRYYGRPVGNLPNASKIYCTVVAYNGVGESTDGPLGVPARPYNIHYDVR